MTKKIQTWFYCEGIKQYRYHLKYPRVLGHERFELTYNRANSCYFRKYIV